VIGIISRERLSAGYWWSVLFVVGLIVADSLSLDPLVWMGKDASLLVAGLRPKAIASLKKIEELPDASSTGSLLPGQVA
jgi:hypothetical protein